MLREWRSRRAAKENVPAYGVLHDATLRAVAAARPKSDDALLGIGGFGPAKLERYGAGVIGVVKAYETEYEPPSITEAPATSANGASYHDERVREARKIHPRAFERWSDEEDERLRQLVGAGRTTDDIASELQRQPNAVLIRAQRLSLEQALTSNSS